MYAAGKCVLQDTLYVTQLGEDVGLLQLMLEKLPQWFMLYQFMQHIFLQGLSVQSPLRHHMVMETK